MSKLFDSINIKNIKIKNRIVLPPLVRFSMVGKDGFVTERVVEWYKDVCAGGTGLVIVEVYLADSDAE